MKKKERLQNWLSAWNSEHHCEFPKEYLAYFLCFNAGDFYEAHDVLEHLWLQCSDANRSFYQALIQFAGGFVHLQKHSQFPKHPTHKRRLSPARRLFALAAKRLAAYPEIHLGLEVSRVLEHCTLWSARALAAEIASSPPSESPLSAFPPPNLTLL
ncbi:MAG: DUF309 domain-containing protein [Verrucomicrobia bacterium]|nr:DUF309 domain-containing protein [Verrucomicrobiota bacterium]